MVSFYFGMNDMNSRSLQFCIGINHIQYIETTRQPDGNHPPKPPPIAAPFRSKTTTPAKRRTDQQMNARNTTMKTLIAASAIVLATATGAFADSTALDVFHPVKNETAVDYTATASIGGAAPVYQNDRLGDGSPRYDNAQVSGGIDFTATASIGQATFGFENARLGDGSPQY
jgi:hypothetical protein